MQHQSESKLTAACQPVCRHAVTDRIRLCKPIIMPDATSYPFATSTANLPRTGSSRKIHSSTQLASQSVTHNEQGTVWRSRST